MCIVNDAIEYGICISRIPYQIVPVVNGEL